MGLETDITISYRDEGRGMGALWDHHTIQVMSDRESKICAPINLKPTAINDLLSQLKASQHATALLPQSLGQCPELADNYGQGLLVIPGHTRKTALKRPEVYKTRKTFEEELLRDAIVRGRPVLAICGGSWRLWGVLGGGEYVATPGHDYPQQHPNDDLMISDKGEVRGNVMAHGLALNEESKLRQAMGLKAHEEIEVNSVHWQAVYEHEKPKNVLVSAYAKPFKEKALSFFWRGIQAILSWFGVKFPSIRPEDKTVEAFETENGAPMIGVQWHPEAYANGGSYALFQRKLFDYMAKAGDAFAHKQEVLKEIKVNRVSPHPVETAHGAQHEMSENRSNILRL